MQKKLIALAIAGLASSAAFAQSNVTIYGRMDLGYVNYGGNSGGVQNIDNMTRMDQGVAAGSRIGFKGAEDLGNGLKAIFEEEFGTYPDAPKGGAQASTAGWTNRHAYLGLTGGFGTVVAGRLDGVRYGIFNKYDAFGGGTAGNFTQITQQVDRADNAVAYISPDLSGFQIVVAYAGQVAGAENNGNHNDQQLNTLNVNYNNGPLSLAVDYETIKSKKEALTPVAGFINTSTTDVTKDGCGNTIVAVTTGNTVPACSLNGHVDAKVTTVAGSYDFGVVKVSALWDSHKADIGTVSNKVDYRDWFIGVRAPIGAATLKAMYGKVDDKTSANADASKWGLGVDYNLSKRTQLFVDYGKIKNDNSNSKYQISVAANGYSTLNSTGSNAVGVRAIDFGIAHNF